MEGASWVLVWVTITAQNSHVQSDLGYFATEKACRAAEGFYQRAGILADCFYDREGEPKLRLLTDEELLAFQITIAGKECALR